MIAVSSRHPTIPRSCLAPELLLLELRSVLLPKYWPCLTLGRQVARRKDSLPLLPAQFPGPPQKRSRTAGDLMKDRYPSSCRLIVPTSIPSSSSSSTSINSCEKPSVQKHSDSVRVTP